MVCPNSAMPASFAATCRRFVTSRLPGMIAAVPEDPLSRRSLLRLDFGRWARPDPAAVKDELAARWAAGAEALHRAWEPLAPVLCDAAGLEAGARVLDAGTGDGNVALEAARRGAEVTAVDLASEQLGRAM